MSRQFAVFDIDGTLIRWQLYHVLVNKLASAGALGNNAHQELEAAMMVWKRRESNDAFKTYESDLVKIYEKALHNISTELFDKLVLEVIDEYKDQTYAYTRELLKQLKKDGYLLFIISGSHHELIEQIAKYYGFDDWIGTHYERDEKGFTGKVHLSTLAKDKPLTEMIERHNVSLTGSVGIGDSGSDIAMLSMIENPIAFNPDQKLLKAAQQRGWKIVLERKNVIYELESRDGHYVLAKTNAG